MAKSRSSRSVRTTYRLVDQISYFAIILIGVAMLIQMLSALGIDGLTSVARWCSNIAQIIAYGILIWNSYYFALSKGTKSIWFIIWLVIVILLIVTYFFGSYWYLFK